MDGGLLQKQSKQVINMTMGTRTEVSNKDAGEEGGGGGGQGGVGGELCRGGNRRGRRDTKAEKKMQERSKRTENFDVCPPCQLNRAR